MAKPESLDWISPREEEPLPPPDKEDEDEAEQDEPESDEDPPETNGDDTLEPPEADGGEPNPPAEIDGMDEENPLDNEATGDPFANTDWSKWYKLEAPQAAVDIGPPPVETLVPEPMLAPTLVEPANRAPTEHQPPLPHSDPLPEPEKDVQDASFEELERHLDEGGFATQLIWEG